MSIHKSVLTMTAVPIKMGSRYQRLNLGSVSRMIQKRKREKKAKGESGK